MQAYKVAYYMNIGLRDEQEDCIFANGKVIQEHKIKNTDIERGDKAVFAVCDGMGGHDKGAWASGFACKKLKENLECFEFSGEFIQGLFRKIQKEIEKEEANNSGTTVAGVALKGNHAKIFNAGDSRVYKITKEDIIYISHDHSLVQSGVDAYSISEEDAFNHPYKNVIEFGIGNVFKNEWDNGRKEFYIRDDDLGAEEYYLICTDGVNDVMRDKEIFDILHSDPFDKFSEFVKYLDERMRDNLSSIIIGNI